ncbi:hypothetical protein M409DRAFT_18543 [Zasmidium cellare ATCC 36951]|uniref:triacylglycerol lipase n=1 Tax=Zasmidium cellare ATCC 36951 TaxID=1080233 RepID=A0A6A6D1A7_ZASCE|nr:uncharacterized protein M409DRAFT_18543 [Zasmidium cellare ATCC 36951]KAF2171426.1 hypothetical protein M409DRAFT_18543 [Zasmidium cellare ATCC 36951]
MRWALSTTGLALLYAAVSANSYEGSQQVLGGTASTVNEDAEVKTLRLRHIHHAGSYRYAGLHLTMEAENLTTSVSGLDIGDLGVKTTEMAIERLTHRDPSEIDALLAQSISPSWTIDSIHAPNVSDKQTVLSFARMSANAYYEGVNRTGWKWKDISPGYNYTLDFGWEEDGLRGHVFVDGSNESVVLALKGTSVPWLDDPTTTHRDLLNDNLFGSCCCARGGSLFWQPVCDCKVSRGTCNTTCLEHELRNNSNYYSAARKIFDSVQSHYHDSEIWLTGHSLGGVVASMLGHTYGAPTLTFETFPEALAASRLGLPTPPGHHVGKSSTSPSSHIFHFGNTADPIFMSSCKSSLSSCSLWGYAFESQCHSGRRCVYDTVGELGWWVEVRNHGIERVIAGVLEKWEGVPECVVVEGCGDCEGWEFV